MDWNIDYALSSIVSLLAIFAFFLAQRRLNIRENRRFMQLLISLFAYFFFEILSTVLDSSLQPEPFMNILTWIANFGYFLSLLLQAYFFYLFFTAHIRLPKGKLRVLLYGASGIPVLIAFIILCLSPSLHTVFYLTKGGQYNGGSLYNVYVGLAAIYTVLSVAALLVFRKRFRLRTITVLIIASSLLLVGYCLRFALPKIVILPTFTVLSVIVVFIGVQNPRHYLDDRTGLFAQSGISLLIDEAIKEKRNAPLILLVITQYQKSRDLYRDKLMSDALSEISNFLKNQPMDKDMSYNHEGRFSIVFNSVEDAKLMESLISARFMNYDTMKNKDGLNLNVGIIESLDSSAYSNGEEYLLSVQRAANSAKAGKIISFDNVLREKQTREKYVHACLDKAIKEKSVLVYFQPLKDLKSGKIAGAESLVRIKGMDGELIGPGEFIYLAEQNGAIKELSDIVYEKTLDFLADHPKETMGLKVFSVNLSPIQCMDPGMADYLISKAEEKGVGLSRINFEITESAFINLDILRKQMEKIIAAGASFSLDDFGTGYSDLSRVTTLPFSAIKFDISLVRSYCAGQNAFLPYLSKAVKDSNRIIVAEGIENLEVEAKVVDLEIDYGQGFLYSKVLPEDEFLKFLEKNK